MKLESGREIELKPINFFKRLEILDVAYEKHLKGLPLSWEVCGKCIQYATGLSEKELGDWTDQEILEAGSIIFAELQKSEIDKKK